MYITLQAWKKCKDRHRPIGGSIIRHHRTLSN